MSEQAQTRQFDQSAAKKLRGNEKPELGAGNVNVGRGQAEQDEDNKQLQSQDTSNQQIRLGEGDFGSFGLLPVLSDVNPFGLFQSPLQSLMSFNDPLFDRASVMARVPTMDFDETDKDYQLTVDLPGLKRDDVKVDVSGRVVSISAEQRKEERKRGSYRRSYGTFTRSLVLPDDAIADKVGAKMEHGQLKVIIPKQEKQEPRTRAINVE